MDKILNTREFYVLLYYGIFLSAICLIDVNFPGGAHFPGPSILVILLFLLVSAAYIIRQFVKWTSDKSYSRSLLLHLLVWVCIWFWVKYGDVYFHSR